MLKTNGIPSIAKQVEILLHGHPHWCAGDPSLKYDDNGWIFGTRAKALATAALVCPEPALPAGKVKIMFWGHWDSC